MELTRFRFFLAVAEFGSFSRAADELGVTQPSVSAGVQRLERSVRGVLFERTRPVRLTSLGQELRPLIAELIRAAERIEKLVMQSAGWWGEPGCSELFGRLPSVSPDGEALSLSAAAVASTDGNAQVVAIRSELEQLKEKLAELRRLSGS
jgi:DNA-binding transcriptional LysR family regulator